jgi:hypothetical protein
MRRKRKNSGTVMLLIGRWDDDRRLPYARACHSHVCVHEYVAAIMNVSHSRCDSVSLTLTIPGQKNKRKVDDSREAMQQQRIKPG